MLNINKGLPLVGVGLNANAADVQILLIEPQDRRRQLPREVCRHQHKPHILCKLVLGELIPRQKIQQPLFSVIIAVAVLQILGKDLYSTSRRESGNHRCVTNALKLHMATVFGALKLDDDYVGVLVDPQQVDLSARFRPFTEFFRNHQGVR